METAVTPGHWSDCPPDGPCPVTHTLSTMNGKWTLLVVHQLLGGTKRFTEIRRGLDGLNPRTLAERLRMLEAGGIVTREVFAEVPPRVQYSLTERGQSLAPVLAAMAEWGNRDLVLQAGGT
jgi:DNA-binding HxlR family transcriptional regulator